MSKLPYSSIPESPVAYSPGSVISKMLDGIGYRYYWSTDGLTPENISYRAAKDSRSLFELIVHIYDLVHGIEKVAVDEVIKPPYDFSSLSFDELRTMTLTSIERSSQIFLHNGESIGAFNLKFQRDEKIWEFPMWNVLVGPITDTAYHIGQVVFLRRLAGNPIHPKVDPFIGQAPY